MENEAGSGFADNNLVAGGVTPRVWPVGALCRAVGDALEARFGAVRVQGEVTGFVRAASGHCYFTLKDADGQLRCAMFRRAASLMNWQPRDGDQVEAAGRLAVYEARGELQLVVESLRRAGQGALYEAFLRIKAELQAQGLFDADRKRPLTGYPRGLGLVTSLEAAALCDVATALQRRAPHVPVLLAPAPVQGAQAPAALIAALQRLYGVAKAQQRNDPSVAHLPPIDTILLVRGGGSLEDLWAFNDPQLAHTIVQSPVPVVVGVGHETDITIADLCADLRAPTPTAAAELAAVPKEDAWTQAQGRFAFVQQEARRWLDRQTQTLDRLAWGLARTGSRLQEQALRLHGMELRWRQLRAAPLLRRQQQLRELHLRLLRLSAQNGGIHRYTVPLQATHDALSRLAHQALGQQRQQLDALQQRWHQAAQARLAQHTARLQQIGLGLHLLHPAHVLQRGYALLQDAQSAQVLQHPGDFFMGQEVRATLAEGEVLLTPLSSAKTEAGTKNNAR
ncbi:MAG: exodeoxyribonuclease VII large subunit [Brachymonas sp.]|nr:exodeoxyribonuclease VII large subunit [Brachymonas sp.]